jgi:hypothetical protein
MKRRRSMRWPATRRSSAKPLSTFPLACRARIRAIPWTDMRGMRHCIVDDYLAADTAVNELCPPASARFGKGALRVLTKGNVGSHAIGGGPRRAKQPAFRLIFN